MIQTYSSTIRRKEMDAVLTCMVDEKIGPGEMARRLVQSVKEFFPVDGALALRSPAIALKYVLRAFGLEPGTGIIVSALAPLWQLQAVQELGFKPIVTDVSPDTACLTVDALEEGIRQGGRLIIFTETAGYLPDFEAIQALGVPLVEDISRSVGAFHNLPAKEGEEQQVKRAGTYGVFSIMGLEEGDAVTGGGGAVLMAPARREWSILKRLGEEAPSTDLLPDLNSALAFIQLKEFSRNESVRQELFAAFQKALMAGRHKCLMRTPNGSSSVSSFTVVLSSGLKDVRQYASRKGIEIQPTFNSSIAAFLDEQLEGCINARSLYLRTVDFPLYPRLGSTHASTIAKVLGTLP